MRAAPSCAALRGGPRPQAQDSPGADKSVVMIRAAGLTAVLGPAGGLPTSATGGPPPPHLLPLRVAHPPPPDLAHFGGAPARPPAGHVFNGVTVTPANQTLASWGVTCAATVKGRTVPSRQNRYYDPQGRITAIVCSWKIPAKPRGPLTAD